MKSLGSGLHARQKSNVPPETDMSSSVNMKRKSSSSAQSDDVATSARVIVESSWCSDGRGSAYSSRTIRSVRSTEKLTPPIAPAAARTSATMSTATTSASKRLAGSLAHTLPPSPASLIVSSVAKRHVKTVESESSVVTSSSGMPYHATHMSSVLSRISIGKKSWKARWPTALSHSRPHLPAGGPSQSRRGASTTASTTSVKPDASAASSSSSPRATTTPLATSSCLRASSFSLTDAFCARSTCS